MSLMTLLVFAGALMMAAGSPGPSIAALVARVLSRGARDVLPFLAAMWIGEGIWLTCAVLGLAAIAETFHAAFVAIKWFGVAYLIYLGWKQWMAPPAAVAVASGDAAHGRPWSLVMRGFVVNASNPKAIVFILAVLPQFLDPTRPLLAQYLILAATMIAVDLVVMAGYTGLAARVLRLLRAPHHQRMLNRSFGGLFVGAALLLATVRRAAHTTPGA